ncbi:hypothetical protein P2318_33965 [Myxococcaceae bacterium GXIMD 01537]
MSLPRPPATLGRPSAAVLALAALYGALLLWRHLDVFSIDVAGHLASAMAFRRGYYHQFNDGAFLGYVQDLFYPPLEDALLGALLFLPLEPLTVYKVFLALVVAGYLAGLGALARRFHGAGPRLFFVVASALLFYAHKGEGFAQGLSFVDLIRVGITSQFLGGAFYLALAAELYEAPRPRRVALLVAGVILSHLIMGLAALALVALALPRHRSVKLLAALALAAGMSACFWLPFLAHRGLLVRNLVMVARTCAPIAAACLPVVLLSGAEPVRRLAAGAVALMVPSLVAALVPEAPWLPALHYYRFDICGVVLVPAVAAAAWDSAPEAARWRAAVVRGSATVALGLVALLLVVPSGLTHPGRLAREGSSFEREPASGPPDARFGRHFVLEYARAFDFAVENYLGVLDEASRGPKGLFWESSRGNHLVSSYLATLVGRPVILDHYFFGNYTCDFQQCVLEHFLSDYNITRFSVDQRVLEARALPAVVPLEGIASKPACYARTFADGGTGRYRFTPEPSFAVNGEPFRTVRVEPREGGAPALNGAVELLQPWELKRLEPAERNFFNPYFLTLGPPCREGRYERFTLVEDTDWEALHAAISDAGGAVGGRPEARELRKVGRGAYELELPRGRPRLFKVKLAWFPGVRLVDERGVERPLFRGYPHLLGLGEGPLRLEYRRTPSMWAGYALSAAAWLAFLAWVLAARRRARQSA